MADARIIGNSIRIGSYFSVSFQRTLRIPDDGRTYPLPPGLGQFPLRRVADFAAKVPSTWRDRGGVLLPMYQREAMWLLFETEGRMPCAVKVAVGKINAVSGEPWDEKIVPGRQDYVVCPDQPWLDGINAGDGYIRQFVAMPLGMGYTVEGQVGGKEEFGGIQIVVFAPKPGWQPPRPPVELYSDFICCCLSAPMEMGLAAGGRMRQEIYPDPHGAEIWSEKSAGRVFVHIANSMAYREITGAEPPATPVSARAYTEAGLPWFDLYDEGKGDVPASSVLAGVKSVKEKDAEHGFAAQQDDEPVEVPAEKVKKLGKWSFGVTVEDGKW